MRLSQLERIYRAFIAFVCVGGLEWVSVERRCVAAPRVTLDQPKTQRDAPELKAQDYSKAQSDEDLDDVTVRASRSRLHSRDQSASLDSHRVETERVLTELGAWSTTAGGQGARAEVQLRGAGGHQSGFYLDEVPLHSLRGQAVDLSLFPLELFSSVHVTHGADGSRAGSGAIGGSVQLSGPKPPVGIERRVALGMSTQRWGQLHGRLGWGEDDGGVVAGVSLSGGPNKFPYRDALGQARRRAQSDFERIAALARGELKHARHHLRASVGFGKLRRGEPGPEGFTLPGRESAQEALWMSLSDQIRRRWALGELKARLTAHALRLRYLFSDPSALGFTSGDGEYAFRDQRVAVTGELEWERAWLKLGLKGALGATRSMTRGRERGRTNSALTPHVSLALSERWLLESGTRLDGNTERDLQTVTSARLTYLAPQIRGQMWIGWSQVWRDPGFDERWLEGPGLVANPDLKPEVGQWLELGARTRHHWSTRSARGAVELSAKAFGQAYERLITYIPLDPYRYRAENLDGADVWGAEGRLALSAQRGHLRVHMRGQLSALKHETRHAPHAPLPLRPQRFGAARFALTQLVASGHVQGALSVLGRGAVTSDRFGERKLDPRSVWRLSTSRVWRDVSGHRLSLYIACDNLFNHTGYDFALTPRAGRSVWVSLEWSD